MKLYLKKISAEAVLPSFAHPTDAGLDLCTTIPINIAPGERVSIPTGIAMQIEPGYVGLIWDKSGISQKGGLKTLGGVVDAGYRGEIFVGLLNTSTQAYSFLPGQKVAQILIQKIEQPVIEIVDSLEESSRGDGAFGSTGK